jgi:hypothetical protein
MDVWSLWSFARDFVFAGHSGGYFFKWDGSNWTFSSVGGGIKTGVSGVSRTDVWSVDSGLPWVDHWDGNSWTLNDQPVVGLTSRLLGVVMVSSSDVFAVGQNGTIIHFDGAGWSLAASPTTASLNDVSYRAGFGTYAVGASGIVVQRNGTGNWVIVPTGTAANLKSVWISPSGVVWIAGEGGTLFHL